MVQKRSGEEAKRQPSSGREQKRGGLSDLLLSVGALFAAAMLLYSLISLFTVHRIELNPYGLLLFFFPFLGLAPAFARPGALATAAILLTSLVGTAVMADAVFHVGYLWGAAGWAAFMVAMYPSLYGDHKPSYYDYPDYDRSGQYIDDDQYMPAPLLETYRDMADMYNSWGPYEAMKEGLDRD